MTEQIFQIEFDGYWRDINKSNIPNKPGIYCVYECTYNKENSTVAIHKLIYIGESENINLRIASHERLEDWKKTIKPENQICYSVAIVENSEDRKKIESALIFKHEPEQNMNYVNQFPFGKIKIISSGKTALLNTDFSI
jgi:excinuclease UvrABC nuclease subunit